MMNKELFFAELIKKDQEIGAFLSVDQAGSADEMIEGTTAPLAGLAMGIKDNIAVKGQPLTCASKMLEDHRAGYDATVIERLRKAGAWFVGKTNMDEFAMGGSTENSALKTTRNPIALDHVPGGSSGGSAAAVAGGLVPAALGSDTGGSIRQPASYCGIVGLKPTYGRVSRYGLVAFASSFDQIGPMTQTLEECEQIFSVIAGEDEKDPTCVGDTYQVQDALDDFSSLRVGILADIASMGVSKDVENNYQTFCNEFRSAGAQVRAIDFMLPSEAVSVYYVLSSAEASSNLGRYDGIRYGAKGEGSSVEETMRASRASGFGLEVKRRVLFGTHVLSAGYQDQLYKKAQRYRAGLRETMKALFASYDLILMPTAPTPAFAFGAHTDDPMAMYLEDAFTVPASLTGIPAISIPYGTSSQGLPIGMQVMAGHGREETIFSVLKGLEVKNGVFGRRG
jgi:aspartyl-tRNA(Asn)/glutamyl-tRNA(Gln) amidotransferase subunit A